MNVTVPVTEVGSVAVKVTGWFTVEGFADDVSVITGVVLLTTWVRLAVAVLKFESPL